MATVNAILASSPLSGLKHVNSAGGRNLVVTVQLAERLADLESAPTRSFVVLSRAASAQAEDYRIDMALRWAAIHQVSAVAVVHADGRWRPSRTAADIANRAGIALVSVPPQTQLSWLLLAIVREIGGGAEQALGRAERALAAVIEAEKADTGIDGLRDAVAEALGTTIEYHETPAAWAPHGADAARTRPARSRPPISSRAQDADSLAAPSATALAPVPGPLTLTVATVPAGAPVPGLALDPREVIVPVVVSGQPTAYFSAPDAHGDLAIAARLVLNVAAAAAARLLDVTRHVHELPERSRSQLLAELLLSESVINEGLADRAMQLGIPLTGWHVAVRIEAENLDELKRDEVHGFEMLEIAGQAALQAAARSGGTWYASRVGRTIVLVRMTSSDPGPQSGLRVSRAADVALAAIRARLPGVQVRAGVGAPHEGPLGLRASAAEARVALVAARAAGKADGVAAHDAVGVKRMLIEWYASDTARESVHSQLAPLEQLGPGRGETAIQTLAAYLDHQGSIIQTAKALHLHRNAVAYRLRQITDVLGVDLDDPDQRLALQLACRARLLS